MHQSGVCNNIMGVAQTVVRVRRPVQHQLRPVAATEALSQLSCLKSSFFLQGVSFGGLRRRAMAE